MANGQPGAPRDNHNRTGKGLKPRGRIAVTMSVSDQTEISAGIHVDLRRRFEDYLLAQGIMPTEQAIRDLARQWAYEMWWGRLTRAEDEQAMIV